MPSVEPSGPEYRAHDREAPIRCGNKHAIAVFMHGDVICARCGEPLIVLHERELLGDAAEHAETVLVTLPARLPYGRPNGSAPAA